MSQTSENLIPAATGQDLGDSTHRWDLYAQNVDISGNTVSKRIGSIRMVDSYTGATLEAQLTAALAEADTSDAICFIERSLSLSENPSAFIGSGFFLHRKISGQNVPANEFLVQAAYDPYVLVYNSTPKVNVASAVRSSNVVTVTTTTAHGLYPTANVYLENIGGGATSFNGYKTVASTPTAYTFTFAQVAVNESANTNTGTSQGSGNAGIVFQTSTDSTVSGTTPQNNWALRVLRQTDGTISYGITQKFVEAGTDALDRLYFKEISTIATNAGVGTTEQGGLQGNMSCYGFFGSIAQVNDTTGRGGLFLQNRAGTQIWLATGGASASDLYLQTSRNATNALWQVKMDGTGSSAHSMVPQVFPCSCQKVCSLALALRHLPDVEHRQDWQR
jgi:hypothetical protein